MTDDERRAEDQRVQDVTTEAVAKLLPFNEGWHFALVLVRSSSAPGAMDGYMGATFDRGLGVDGAAEVLHDARDRMLSHRKALEASDDGESVQIDGRPPLKH